MSQPEVTSKATNGKKQGEDGSGRKHLPRPRRPPPNPAKFSRTPPQQQAAFHHQQTNTPRVRIPNLIWNNQVPLSPPTTPPKVGGQVRFATPVATVAPLQETAKEQLSKLCQSWGWEKPIYKTYEDSEKSQITGKDGKRKTINKKIFYAKVELGGGEVPVRKFSSINTPKPSGGAAEEEVASQALKELRFNIKEIKLINTASKAAERDSDPKLIAARVRSIIDEKSGKQRLMNASNIEEQYALRHQRRPAQNWIDLIQEVDADFEVNKPTANLTLVGLPFQVHSGGSSKSSICSETSSLTSDASSSFTSPVRAVPKSPETTPSRAPAKADEDDGEPQEDDLESKNFIGSLEPIPPAILPAASESEDDWWDVHITYAVSPSNFYAMPYESTLKDSAFRKLEDELQSFYVDNSEENHIELSAELIKRGMHLAVQHGTRWFRGEVKVCEFNSEVFWALVYLVDSGRVVTIDQLAHLQPLYAQFRTVPIQAVHCRVSQIKPDGCPSWSREAGDYFRNLVELRDLVGRVLGVERLNPKSTDQIVKVSLHDASGEEEVTIDVELVKAGHAIAVTL